MTRRTPTNIVRPGGFTIIEVMVAILLLSVSIVSIFGAQFAAVATVEYSRNVTQAAQLARCRMSEIELEFLMNDGFEEGDIISSGECCELLDGESSQADYTCRWEIKTIEMPDISQMMTGGGDGGVLDDMSGGMMGDMMGDSTGDDLGEMGMGMIGPFLPLITELLQQAIRRVTVVVEWTQGSRQKELEIVQYVVHPTQGPLQLMQQVNTMDQISEMGNPEEMPTSGKGGKR
jgi:prepilin-type N-terminal cleavage/methylation domain-containing protein